MLAPTCPKSSSNPSPSPADTFSSGLSPCSWVLVLSFSPGQGFPNTFVSYQLGICRWHTSAWLYACPLAAMRQRRWQVEETPWQGSALLDTH